jgi:hypothetical protein
MIKMAEKFDYEIKFVIGEEFFEIFLNFFEESLKPLGIKPRINRISRIDGKKSKMW